MKKVFCSVNFISKWGLDMFGIEAKKINEGNS